MCSTFFANLISQYSTTLGRNAILAPKCQFPDAFLRVTFKKHGNFESRALYISAGTSTASQNAYPSISK